MEKVLKKRQSNFELLRIVAMFMVLILHALHAWDFPKDRQLIEDPLNSFFNVHFNSMTIVAVNVFVMISGWFGIKSTVKGLCKFLFQCVFLTLLVDAVSILSGAEAPVKSIISDLMTFGFWFVPAYVGLYMLSPILNSFIEKVSKRQFEIFLTGFFIYQTFYGCIGHYTVIDRGYSVFSFIGLYLLASYLRKYCGSLSKKCGFWTYILSTLVVTIHYYAATLLDIKYFDMYAYSNPFVISGAAGLIIFFSRLNVAQSRIINSVGESAFSVYIIHVNAFLFPLFIAVVCDIHDSCQGILCVMLILLFLIGVFAVSISVDKLRKWIWEHLSSMIFKDKATQDKFDAMV